MTALSEIGARVRSRLGIHLGPHKEYLLAARVEKLLTREGYPSAETLLGLLDAGDARAWDALARYLTTNHTFFFREPEQFGTLVRLLRDRGVERPRVWSAAGSTGEEGYSLAITLAEAGFADYLILVSDVNRDVLRHAHRGIYDAARMQKIPRGATARYFSAEPDGQFRIKDELRRRVRFRCVNLMQPLERTEPVDAIFCRNMLIYFDAEGVREVLARLVSVLRPGGWLFLGQTEGFQLPPGPVRALGSSVYQKL